MQRNTWLRLRQLTAESESHDCTMIITCTCTYRLERQGEFKVALRCYREALADNPESEPAKTRAGLLTAALEKKVCHKTYGIYIYIYIYIYI